MNELQPAFYRISVKALIFNSEGEFLLCKEEKGVWDLPGGGLDHGENPETCIQRELREEVGLEILSISSVPEVFVTAHKPKSATRPWIANACYEVKVKNLDFIASDECVEIGFFSLKTLRDIEVLPNVTEVGKALEKSD